jgi:hypothetical protein
MTLRPDDMASVRQALRMATDEDIAKAAQQLGLVPPGGKK